MESLNRLSSFTLPTGIVQKTTQLKTVLDNVKTMRDAFSEIQTGVAQEMQEGRVDIVTATVSSIRTWITTLDAAATEIQSAGSSINRINVAMSRIQSGLGLRGQNAEPITIRRRDLTINIPISVTMAGTELQTVLVNVANTTQPNQPRLQVQAATR
jgi:hypothetical protein